MFFFSPYFSTEEKKDGLHKALTGADPAIVNFLELLLENHRMPVIFRIRASSSGCGTRRTSCCPSRSPARSTSTTATVKSIGERIGEQTGQHVELTSTVDPTILGGIVLRVGNSILDASIQHRLDQLRKHVAQA